jgi:hypothetical protein
MTLAEILLGITLALSLAFMLWTVWLLRKLR